MKGKLIIKFSNAAPAKRFIEKVKKLPYVTYATDYSRGDGRSNVMVCGEFDEEREAEVLKLKRYRNADS